MAIRKNKTALFIAGGVVLVGVVYLVTRKPATPAPGPATTPIPTTGGTTTLPGLLSQGISALSNLFSGGGSGSLYAPFTPVGVDRITAPSPASGINYINPSTSGPTITAPTTQPPSGDIWDDL